MALRLLLRDGESVSADVLQRLLGSEFAQLSAPTGVGTGYATGMVGSVLSASTGHLAVTANGTTLVLTILPGWAVVIRDAGASSYDPRALMVESDANLTATITANATGSTRNDTVCLKVDMATAPASDGSNLVSLVIIAGQSGGGLSNAPADGNLYLPLANVAVANGATSVAQGNVTDKRAGFEDPAQDFKATGAASLASPASSRYVGAWTTVGAPTGLTGQANDYGFDGNKTLWICTAAGSPGTWSAVPLGKYQGRMFLTAAQTPATGDVKILVDTQDFDGGGGIVDTVNKRINFLVPGRWLVSGGFAAAPGSAQSGTAKLRYTATAGNQIAGTLSGTATAFSCAAGPDIFNTTVTTDYVELFCNLSASFALTTGKYATWLMAVWLGK
jgi:hypothetical protein